MRIILYKCLLFLTIVMLGLFASCKQPTNSMNVAIAPSLSETITKEKPGNISLSKQFKDYWYAGNAELTSYALEQARYGELRKGTAVLVYVTEPFLPGKQVKAERNDPDNIPVLKLNATKKFLTGMYPYSIMTSSFYPVNDGGHALKVATSIQEWCGQVYFQLNNREQYEYTSHSYFENEADQVLKMPKAILENELWNKIRINPEALPLGTFEVVPSFEYLRLGHKKMKSYAAELSMERSETFNIYSITYPELERSVSITFTKAFPYSIEGWTESYRSGFGMEAKKLTSRATKIKTLKTPYWRKNRNEDVSLRDSLGL